MALQSRVAQQCTANLGIGEPGCVHDDGVDLGDGQRPHASDVSDLGDGDLGVAQEQLPDVFAVGLLESHALGQVAVHRQSPTVGQPEMPDALVD